VAGGRATFSELATFDLVIIDEASQSDITSLPTVLKGEKLLVVGDDKQVSPSAVGMNASLVAEMLFQVLEAGLGPFVERRGLRNRRTRRDSLP
jgi:superfamily I DNA and/or RNA helicase